MNGMGRATCRSPELREPRSMMREWPSTRRIPLSASKNWNVGEADAEEHGDAGRSVHVEGQGVAFADGGARRHGDRLARQHRGPARRDLEAQAVLSVGAEGAERAEPSRSPRTS